MKKIIICAVLLIIATATFSQESNPAPTLTKQDYLKKSKTQKTGAWILLGTGVFFTAGSSAQFRLDGDTGGSKNQTAFLVIGLAEIGASIPLFIASSKNKRKAISLSFKRETSQQIYKSSFVYKPVPSLTLKISL